MRCMQLRWFDRLKIKGKESEAEKKGCHIRVDPVMQIARISLPVLVAGVPA